MTDSLHLVCPRCHAINRLPADRLDQSPRCGQCHNALFDGHPVALSAESFARHVGRCDLPVLVDFWAPWCGPCKSMAPHFAKAAEVLEPRARLAKVDTEAEPELGARFGIRSVPTLALFRGGREIARQSGAMAVQDIIAWTRAHL